MEVYKVDPESIVVGARARSVNPERVAVLVQSMRTLGLQTPVTVWASEDGAEVHLIAGAHRVAAAIELGWDEIDCALVTMSEIDRKRWEIAENLHRSELTVLERDQHIAEWIRLTEEVSRISAQPEQKSDTHKKRGRPSVGVSTAARDLGIEKEDARRAVKVASLTDEAKETAREVGLDDNRSALLKAAAEPVEKQSQALRDIAARKEAKEKIEDSDVQWSAEDEASYSDLLDAWDAATPAARKQFLREYARRAAA